MALQVEPVLRIYPETAPQPKRDQFTVPSPPDARYASAIMAIEIFMPGMRTGIFAP